MAAVDFLVCFSSAGAAWSRVSSLICLGPDRMFDAKDLARCSSLPHGISHFLAVLLGILYKVIAGFIWQAIICKNS